jgi:hypothetical protein
MNGPHPFVETIFAVVLELPAVERAAYLEAACAGDAGLRARIASLLRAHDEAACVMATTAFGPFAETRQGSVPTEKPADRIGRYKLLQKFGEGGCGGLCVTAAPTRRVSSAEGYSRSVTLAG